MADETVEDWYAEHCRVTGGDTIICEDGPEVVVLDPLGAADMDEDATKDAIRRLADELESPRLERLQ